MVVRVSAAELVVRRTVNTTNSPSQNMVNWKIELDQVVMRLRGSNNLVIISVLLLTGSS